MLTAKLHALAHARTQATDAVVADASNSWLFRLLLAVLAATTYAGAAPAYAADLTDLTDLACCEAPSSAPEDPTAHTRAEAGQAWTLHRLHADADADADLADSPLPAPQAVATPPAAAAPHTTQAPSTPSTLASHFAAAVIDTAPTRAGPTR